MNDTKDSARETQVRLRITIESALQNLHGLSDDLLSAQIVMLMNAAGYITTAEADLRVAEMRDRAADAAKGIVAANTAKRQWAEALGASESHNAILSLPIIKEGGTQ